MQISDLVLPDLPLAVVGLYTNDTLRSPPVIAVAFSSCIYFYRNLLLYYKYYLPSIELNPSEMEAWKQVSNLLVVLLLDQKRILTARLQHMDWMDMDVQEDLCNATGLVPYTIQPEGFKHELFWTVT